MRESDVEPLFNKTRANFLIYFIVNKGNIKIRNTIMEGVCVELFFMFFFLFPESFGLVYKSVGIII